MKVIYHLSVQETREDILFWKGTGNVLAKEIWFYMILFLFLGSSLVEDCNY